MAVNEFIETITNQACAYYGLIAHHDLSSNGNDVVVGQDDNEELIDYETDNVDYKIDEEQKNNNNSLVKT
jgi:hypothetical protein